MKKIHSFLLLAVCLSLASVSDARPPTDDVIYESKIKQSTVAEFAPVETMALTCYTHEYAIAVNENEYFVTDVKPQPMVQLVCPESPAKSVDGLDVLSYDVAITHSFYRIRDLNFHYIESRATEFRC